MPRFQLLDRLNAGLNGRLTLISAPAGFGKTTLVVHWGRQLEKAEVWRLAWFSLDENDNDLSRFFTYFITALQKIDGRLGQAALELLHSPQATDIQVVLTDLLNTIAQSTQSIVLVLDDYHLITNPAIHESIIFLLENAPPHFHLLLISRADPPFSLARLRARHQITEIRQADLRFGQSETTEFLNHLMALDLPETAVASLEKRTEGWVAGLQMAALSMQGQANIEAFIRGFTSSNRFIFDYLAEEVLAQRPKGTRDFLLQTAVLDRLCAPLCDAVLGITETTYSPSQQNLEQLESANLFLISLDEERRWYRYHHLFADLLQQQQRREQPGLESEIHERASRWFEQAGYAEEAVQYALNAANYERATSLLTHYNETWFRRGEISKIQGWVERLPASWQHKNSQLTLNYAWALLLAGHFKEAEATVAHLPPSFAETSIDLLVLKGTMAVGQGQSAQAIALLEHADAKLKSLESNAANQTLHGMAINALAYSYHLQGEDLRAQKYYQSGITLNQEVGNLFAVLKAIQGWSVLLVRQARLHEAMSILHDSLQTEQQLAKILGTPDRRLVVAAPLHILQGQLYYQWNRLTEAEAQLVDAGKMITISDPADKCVGLMTLAKLRLAQGQAEAVPPILAQLQEIEQQANPPYIRQQLAIAFTRIQCALYRQRPSPDLRTAIEQSLPQLAAVSAEPITQARALIILKRPSEAVPLLEEAAAQTEADGQYDTWLTVAVLLALAYQGVGEKKEALAWLQRAVETAAAPGYIRLFLDKGEPLQQLLEELSQRTAAPTYAATLLTYFPAASQPATLSLASDLLSPREREVLQLIAEGLTNQEIANKLVIAPSTAKRHTINIYNKLDINNRAEATARAYELGIVNLA